MRWALLAVLVTSCAPAAPPPVAQTTPVPSASVAVARSPIVEDAGPPKAPAPVSKCLPLGPGQISDDDHPQLEGIGKGDPISALEWFEKREVTKKSVTAWYAARFGMKAEDAEMRVSELYCHPATMGDPSEEGLVCTTYQVQELMPQRLLGVVVRKKQPATVFQVGLMLGAMDFPEAHHLDLAFRLNPGGKSFDLFERAPDGAQLVPAPSACVAREKSGAPPMPEPMGYPATMHDCEGSKKVLAEMAASSPKDPHWRAAVAGAKTFITKTCSERGHWTWGKDRFIWDPTAQRN